MSNPEILDVDHRQLPAGDNRYIDVILANGESVVKDQALGIVTTSGEYAALQSAAVDGTQLIRAWAAEIGDATGGAITLRVLNEGELDDSKMVFDGADTLETVPTGEDDSYRVALRDYGMTAKTLTDHFIPDNQ